MANECGFAVVVRFVYITRVRVPDAPCLSVRDLLVQTTAGNVRDIKVGKICVVLHRALASLVSPCAPTEDQQRTTAVQAG